MRITMTLKEYTLLVILLDERIQNDDGVNEEYVELKSNLHHQFLKSHTVSTSKRNATKKATYAREIKAKKKIENALNLLRLEGKKITAYSLAKQAEVSFTTARKYIPYYDTSY